MIRLTMCQIAILLTAFFVICVLVFAIFGDSE